MRLTPDLIARTALSVLDETGLDGLSMRLVATRLDVQPAALYWHLKNKQQLLAAMAGVIFNAAVDGLEAPRAGESWQDWLADYARALRRAMLGYRDGALVFAGSNVSEHNLFRATELALRTLQDAGFAVRRAARSMSALVHYTVGFTVEEQVHTSAGEAGHVDAARFPLTAQAYLDDNLFDPDTDDCFEFGLQIILAGMHTTRESRSQATETQVP
ncbi:TetR/AcrR family transcriptional regulator C-terminal domain-containing protein [Kutzneria sp. CA-103260]|uniref:TetR/AcrR family transcriptional regulator C-terminal domain-containing protein n=1 Tax=Kutzneria sp. CA-103260 TaxID=2802641 RepID=UPI001BA4C808|nr:TetR/AcrR family transcriptional regulator C-terminal domain-containing protein [Kutzneria sp. CA-103260]QUQ63241.1 TetR family transcriptional regulator [Kutzneria sp. CA-103260]